MYAENLPLYNGSLFEKNGLAEYIFNGDKFKTYIKLLIFYVLMKKSYWKNMR